MTLFFIIITRPGRKERQKMDKENINYISYNSFDTNEDYYEMLEAAIEKSEVGFLIADAEGKVIKVNQAQINITGQEANYNVGRNMREVEIEDQSPSATIMVCDTLKPVKIEQNLVNGRSYLVYANPHFDANGKLKYVISNLLDTTEINKTRESLEKIRNDNIQLSRQLQELQNQMNPQSKIIHQSRVMRHVILLCDKVAQFDSNVLLQGESGVGKELIAEYIFERSNRNRKPFVKINSASIPEQLLESELFGYEAGSFTGSSGKSKKGLLEYAHEGTLLLDEISELAIPLQAKILRFIQEGEFYRVGGTKPITTDVRIIAASNKDLKLLVNKGLFREDLYYRLNVIPISIPPLKERKEDIPLLVGYFAKKFNEKYNLKKSFNSEVINLLLDLPFRGNVRELQNTIERVMVLSENDIISKKDIMNIMTGFDNNVIEENALSLKEIMQKYEMTVLKQYLDEYKTEENLSRILKISQSTVSRKLNKYKINIR